MSLEQDRNDAPKRIYFEELGKLFAPFSTEGKSLCWIKC